MFNQREYISKLRYLFSNIAEYEECLCGEGMYCLRCDSNAIWDEFDVFLNSVIPIEDREIYK